MELPDVFEDIPPAEKNEAVKKQQSNVIIEKKQRNNDHDVDDEVLCQYLDLMKDDEMIGIPDNKTDEPTDHNGEQTKNDGDEQKEEHGKPKH